MDNFAGSHITVVCSGHKMDETNDDASGGKVNPDSMNYSGILPCAGKREGCYPNVDISIWLR